MVPPKPVPKFAVGDRVLVTNSVARVFRQEFVINEELELRELRWQGSVRRWWGYGLAGTSYRPSQGSIALVESAAFPEML